MSAPHDTLTAQTSYLLHLQPMPATNDAVAQPQARLYHVAQNAAKAPHMLFEGDLSEIPMADGTHNNRLCLLIPAIQSTLLPITLPTACDTKQLTKILPGLMEAQHQLTPTTEQMLCFADHKALILNQKDTHHWLNSCTLKGYTPDIMMPDHMALPATENGWTFYHDERLVRACWGHGAAYASFKSDDAASWLTYLYKSHLPKRVALYCSDENRAAIEALHTSAIETLPNMFEMPSIAVETVAPTWLITQHLAYPHPFDAPSQAHCAPHGSSWRQLRWPAMITCACALLYGLNAWLA